MGSLFSKENITQILCIFGDVIVYTIGKWYEDQKTKTNQKCENILSKNEELIQSSLKPREVATAFVLCQHCKDMELAAKELEKNLNESDKIKIANMKLEDLGF
jgi:hypothetical protein